MKKDRDIRPRALKTEEAAKYLGISAGLLRKYRKVGPGDPGIKGPPFRKISPSIILYDIAALDAWLDARPAQRCSLRQEAMA